jgi:hypothetical protein
MENKTEKHLKIVVYTMLPACRGTAAWVLQLDVGSLLLQVVNESIRRSSQLGFSIYLPGDQAYLR